MLLRLTIGGLADHLDAAHLRLREGALRGVSNIFSANGTPGRAAYGALHGLKTGLADALCRRSFEDWASSTSVL